MIPSQRILIYADELYRLPIPVCHVRAVRGIAYITFAGDDIILHPGECMALDTAPDRALVSPLGNAALTLELFTPYANREGLHTVADKG